MGPVVAAVDGSPRSVNTLAFALEFAKVSGLPVEVLTVVNAYSNATTFEWGPSIDHDAHEQLRDAHQSNRVVVSLAVGDPEAEAELSQRILAGEAVSVLVEASARASFIVVGAPCGGAWHALVHGPSVTQYVVKRARCPVIVVSDAWQWPPGTAVENRRDNRTSPIAYSRSRRPSGHRAALAK